MRRVPAINNVLLCLFEGWQRRQQDNSGVGDPQFLNEQLDACAGRSTDFARLRKVAEILFRGKEAGSGGGDAASGDGQQVMSSTSFFGINLEEK